MGDWLLLDSEYFQYFGIGDICSKFTLNLALDFLNEPYRNTYHRLTKLYGERIELMVILPVIFRLITSRC
jgi:hypothetical protein